MKIRRLYPEERLDFQNLHDKEGTDMTCRKISLKSVVSLMLVTFVIFLMSSCATTRQKVYHGFLYEGEHHRNLRFRSLSLHRQQRWGLCGPGTGCLSDHQNEIKGNSLQKTTYWKGEDHWNRRWALCKSNGPFRESWKKWHRGTDRSLKPNIFNDKK